jgi:hypothetical protein
VDLADIVQHLYGIATHLNLRARGFGFLLALPLFIVSVTDWRITRKR